MLSCFDPLGNAVHTVLSFDLVGEDVLITGAGPIGCMAVPICKRAGARHVVITDVNPYRLDLARKMGVDLALDVRTEKVINAMEKLGMKEGFDVALEMSGNPKAFNDILPNMFHGGKIALLTGDYPPFPLHSIHRSHRVNEVRQFRQNSPRLERALNEQPRITWMPRIF